MTQEKTSSPGNENEEGPEFQGVDGVRNESSFIIVLVIGIKTSLKITKTHGFMKISTYILLDLLVFTKDTYKDIEIYYKLIYWINI